MPGVDLEALQAYLDADPEKATNLLRKILSKQFRPHGPVQEAVLNSECRFNILCAGRRFGKTQVGAARALREAREGKIVWWVAPIYRNVKRGYTAVLGQLHDGELTHAAPNEGAFDAGRSVALKFKGGGRMEFYSAERPEGMLGGSCDFVVLDEAATMQEHVWYQIIQPTLADRQGGALMISTPRGRNWFYKLWMAGQDELQTDVASWRVASTDNPLIPSSEWERQREILPAVTYDQEVLADFISTAASVFRFRDDMVQLTEKPRGHVVLGIDLAKYNDFTVLVGINTDTGKICYHDRFNQVSWPYQRQMIHEAVDVVLESAEGVTVMLDSTGVGDVIHDDLADEGLDTVPIKFTNQWKHAAVQLLAADLERGHVFLCDAQIKEFESYGYEISESTGRWKFQAASGHDDEVSAMLLAYWGIVHAGVPGVKVLTAADDSDDGSPVVDEIPDADVVIDSGLPTWSVTELEPVSASDMMDNPNVWS